jgi:hypothetical protein
LSARFSFHTIAIRVRLGRARAAANCYQDVEKIMTRKSLNLFAAVTAAVLMLPALAAAQTPAPMTINVPQLDQQDFQLWVGKSNAYVELLTTRAIDSLRRYASWVDLKVGPTGKERYISYGLYSIEPSIAAQVIAKTRAAAAGPPPIPPLDGVALAYAASFETLMPLLNDAAGYYERKDYTDDNMARGKELHAKIIPAMNTFLAARAQLEDGQEQLSDGLDRQELALIEAREGKSRLWHLRNLAITAKAALNAMPHDPNATDMTPFSSSIAAYADAVRGFEAAPKPRNAASDGTNAEDLVARFRTLREKIQKKDVRKEDFQDAINEYNSVIDWLNITPN